MKVVLWSVGKAKDNEWKRSLDQYQKRVRKYHPVGMEEIGVRVKSADPDYLRRMEGEQILSRLNQADTLVLWDEKGEMLSSAEFARFLEDKALANTTRLIFLIGGAHGFSSDVYRRAQDQLSLSKMTFPHDLARLMAMEQIYRAFSILNHSPYHH